MNFRVQFFDGSGCVVAEWSAYAHSARGAIELTEGLDWPAGAVRVGAPFGDDGGGRVEELNAKVHRAWISKFSRRQNIPCVFVLLALSPKDTHHPIVR
jgi:hypothetical protein